MPTLSRLLSDLAEQYNTAKRPTRYFDVSKRGNLTPAEVRYVKKRFKEFVEREDCVSSQPDNPECYEQVSTDKSARKKRKSGYLRDYEKIYRESPDPALQSEIRELQALHPRALKGLLRISAETVLPYEMLKEVYDKGVGAYASSGSRPGMSAEQWGYGRVYAFVMSYFHNRGGRYSSGRFLKNKTDIDVYNAYI